MKISILHPSYGRPLMAVKTAQKWLQRATTEVEYILCLTYQDNQLNAYRTFFNSMKVKTVYFGEGNMVKQLNHAATQAAGDLFVNVSDDFDCPEGWDKLLIEGIGSKTDFAIKTEDGIKVEGVDSANIIALPIMDRIYYNRFGYIYHPDYGHFYGDEELSYVADKLGRKITLPITFEHNHYIAGKGKEDATNKKNNRHFENDKATFAKRKAEGFPK